jgi:hypothetical protein
MASSGKIAGRPHVSARLLLVLLVASGAEAATVRGQVALPPDPRTGEHEGHWRVENGVLPIGPRTPDPRTEVVVVLDGGPARAKKDDKPTVSAVLHGMRLEPKVLVASTGATLSIKNEDRVPHSLFTDGAPSLMAAEPTPSNTTRTIKLATTGEYTVRDEECPHLEGTIVVTDAYATVVDEKGNFKLDVPEGRYQLKVFYRGGWALTQPVEVGPRSTELKIDLPPKPQRKEP